MDKFLLAANTSIVGEDIKQNSEEVVADFKRLIGITEILVDVMKDFILMVNVTPVNIMLTKFEDVKDLQFTIMQNPNYSMEESDSKVKECTKLFNELMEGEFLMIKNIKPLQFSKNAYIDKPSITLYSVFPNIEMNAIDDDTYLSLYKIIQDHKYTVSLSGVFDLQGKKTIFIHCRTMADLIQLRKDMSDSLNLYGISMEEYSVDKVHSKPWVYVPVIGHLKLKYEIPLLYIDFSSFNVQRLESILKPEE